jgi:hypothetical protein
LYFMPLEDTVVVVVVGVVKDAIDNDGITDAY